MQRTVTASVTVQMDIMRTFHQANARHVFQAASCAMEEVHKSVQNVRQKLPLQLMILLIISIRPLTNARLAVLQDTMNKIRGLCVFLVSNLVRHAIVLQLTVQVVGAWAASLTIFTLMLFAMSFVRKDSMGTL